MELAGKRMSLTSVVRDPEATGGQYPTLKQELNRQLTVLQSATPGSRQAMEAMIAISEIQNTIDTITAENKKRYP